MVEPPSLAQLVPLAELGVAEPPPWLMGVVNHPQTAVVWPSVFLMLVIGGGSTTPKFFLFIYIVYLNLFIFICLILYPSGFLGVYGDKSQG